MTDPRSHELCAVIVPTLNRADRLLPTLATIRAQTYRPLEIIVSDDGCSDGTADRVRELADARIRVVSAPRPSGVSAARNRGIAHAGHATWIAFCDDDDYWLPEKLSRQIAVMRRTERLWSYCYGVDVDDRLEFISAQGRPAGPDPFRRLLFGDNFVPGGCSTVVVARHLLDQVGPFDTELSMLADLDLWTRLASQAPPAVVTDFGIAYVHHDTQMSMDMSKVRAELAHIRAKNREQRAMLPAPSHEPIDRWVVQRSWISGHRRQAIRHGLQGPGSMLWLWTLLTIGSATARRLIGPRHRPTDEALKVLARIRTILDDEGGAGTLNRRSGEAATHGERKAERSGGR